MFKLYLHKNYFLIENISQNNKCEICSPKKDIKANLENGKLRIELLSNIRFLRVFEFEKLLDSNNLPWASEEALKDWLRENTGNFNSAPGGSGAIGSTQVQDNYSSFNDGSEIGELAYAKQSEGTYWLPFSLGGTYYPAGFYLWDGFDWVSDRNAIANQLQENINALSKLSESVIYVKKASDIVLQTLDSTKKYFLDKEVDILGQPIWVPENGLNLIGWNSKVSKIINSVDNTTAFITDPNGAYAGALRWEGISFQIGGANSQVFDLDNQQQTDNENNNIDLSRIDFVACTSLGRLSNYRQFFIDTYSFIVCGDGLTFDGTWSGGAKFTQGRLLQFSGVIFKAGPTLSFASRFFCDASILVGGEPTNYVCDFTPANIVNDLDFQFNSAQLEGKNSHIEYFPTMPIQSTKVIFSNVTGRGFSNTFIGAFQEVTTELLTPLFGGAGQNESDLLAITTFSDLVHFAATTSGSISYLGTQEIECKFLADLVIDGGGNDVILLTIRIWRNATSDYETIKLVLRAINNNVGGNDRGFFPANVPFKMYELDRFDSFRVTNITDNTNVTLISGSTYSIEKR